MPPNREAQRRRVERLARSEPLNAGRETILSSSASQMLLEQGRSRRAARVGRTTDDDPNPRTPPIPGRQRVGDAAVHDARARGRSPRRRRPSFEPGAIAGWVRVVDADPCYRCQQWDDGKLRPLDARMKAHPNCTCTIRLVFGSEAHSYDSSSEREPVARRPDPAV